MKIKKMTAAAQVLVKDLSPKVIGEFEDFHEEKVELLGFFEGESLKFKESVQCTSNNKILICLKDPDGQLIKETSWGYDEMIDECINAA